jgi:hypothetical protein
MKKTKLQKKSQSELEVDKVLSHELANFKNGDLREAVDVPKIIVDSEMEVEKVRFTQKQDFDL